MTTINAKIRETLLKSFFFLLLYYPLSSLSSNVNNQNSTFQITVLPIQKEDIQAVIYKAFSLKVPSPDNIPIQIWQKL